ncbi:MAG TPA: PDZ domain-containing protein [Gemmatimonadaceae bacterium]
MKKGIERIRRIARTSLVLVVLAVIIPRSAPAQREPVKGWVGVAYTTGIGQTDRSGAMVFKDYPVIESIEPSSPAERAGLEAGDTIIAMNAQDLKKSPLPMAAMIQPGRRVVFRFKRNDSVREVTVTVAARPSGTSERVALRIIESGEPPGPPSERARMETMRRERINAEVGARVPVPPMVALPPLAFGFGPRSLAVAGAELTALNAELRSLVGLNSPGIFVVNVARGTPASESGLRSADVILKADASQVGDPGDLIRVLRESSGSSVRLHIVRKKKPQTITLRW